jgi:hypothetical protein
MAVHTVALQSHRFLTSAVDPLLLQNPRTKPHCALRDKVVRVTFEPLPPGCAIGLVYGFSSEIHLKSIVWMRGRDAISGGGVISTGCGKIWCSRHSFSTLYFYYCFPVFLFHCPAHPLILHRYLFKWRSWMRHCTTSWKVAGSIPDDVTGIFHWHNPSGRTVVSSTSNTNEYQEYFLGVKAAGAYGWQPYHLHMPIV